MFFKGMYWNIRTGNIIILNNIDNNQVKILLLQNELFSNIKNNVYDVFFRQKTFKPIIVIKGLTHRF